jgi:rubrerythrin
MPSSEIPYCGVSTILARVELYEFCRKRRGEAMKSERKAGHTPPQGPAGGRARRRNRPTASVTAPATHGRCAAEEPARQTTPPASGRRRKNPPTEMRHAKHALECPIGDRHGAFATRAKKAGFPNVARLFRAAAEAERIHTAAILMVMGAAEGTARNPGAGALDENRLPTEGLLKSIEHAAKAKGPAAALALAGARDAGRFSQQAFTRCLQALNSGADLPNTAMYVCPACGAVIFGDAHAFCPACTTPKSLLVVA